MPTSLQGFSDEYSAAAISLLLRRRLNFIEFIIFLFMKKETWIRVSLKLQSSCVQLLVLYLPPHLSTHPLEKLTTEIGKAFVFSWSLIVAKLVVHFFSCFEEMFVCPDQNCQAVEEFSPEVSQAVYFALISIEEKMGKVSLRCCSGMTAYAFCETADFSTSLHLSKLQTFLHLITTYRSTVIMVKDGPQVFAVKELLEKSE